MNYPRIYNLLIAKAQTRSNLECYVEKHHVIPKALGGTDESTNLVNLTAREHFIAHMLLAKIHRGKMWYAVICMKGKANRYVNSRLYDIARREQGIAFTGFKHTTATRVKISNASKLRKHTEATKRAIGDANKGKTFRHTLDAKARIGIATALRFKGKVACNKGKPMSEEQKQKLREVWALKKQKGAYACMA